MKVPLLLASAILALASGCDGGRCLTTTDCPGDQRCRGGRCQPPAGPPVDEDADLGRPVDGDADADSDSAADATPDGSADADAPHDGGGDTDVGPPCLSADMGARLGRSHFLIGGEMEGETLARAPFDIVPIWMVGNVPEGGACASCATDCFVDGTSCAEGGCFWWGCWQDDSLPPGRWLTGLIRGIAAAGAIPFVTQYVWDFVARQPGGVEQVAALADPALVERFLSDHRLACQVIGESPAITVVLQLEPYLWAFGRSVDVDPSAIPAAVSAAGAPECAEAPDTLGGLASCMISIARVEAPNVLVAMNAPSWGPGGNALMDPNPSFDIFGDGVRTGMYLTVLGAGAADLLTVEMSDRDAAYDGRWWDPTNETRPSFTGAERWARAVGAVVELPYLWWQVPYGHMGLPDLCNRYQDNRLDYVFDHPDELATAGALGVIFTSGEDCSTTPEADGDHFVTRAAAYYAAGGTPLCGG